MSWNRDISAAPKDRQILMRTTRSNQVFVTNWLEPTKHTPNGRFNGFSENAKTMLAWCEIPDFENSPETATDMADLSFAAVCKGQYAEGYRDAAKNFAVWIETQRNDVPAHGWEFAAAIRELINLDVLFVSLNESETAKSHPTTLAGETAAQSGVAAVESGCPALIDDVGGF